MITDGRTINLDILFLKLKIYELKPDFQLIGFGSVVEKDKWLKIIRKYAVSFFSKGALCEESVISL